MIELFRAIENHAAGSDFFTAVGGRFTYHTAKQGWPTPYCVYWGEMAVARNTGTGSIEDVPVRFKMVASSPAQAGSILTQCLTQFNRAQLAVEGQPLNVILRRNYKVPPYKDGEDWVADIEFSCWMQGE